MARRTILFAVAIIVALLATVSLYAYVSSVNNRAIADAQPVQVLVAKKLIPAGTSAQDASQQGLLTLMSVPRKAVPDGALSNIAPISGLVAISDIYPGEMLLRVKFSQRQATGELIIPGDKLAIAVELGDPERVAGFVVPGSDVAIFDTYQAPTAAGQQSGGLETTGLLLARVPVIAVGPTTLRPSSAAAGKGSGSANAQPVSSTILTLAVTAKEAEKLVHAAQTGKLYFGLLSAQSVTTGAPPSLDNRNLFS